MLPSAAKAPVRVVAEPPPDRQAGRKVPDQKPPSMGQSSRAAPSANAGASERSLHAGGALQCAQASPHRRSAWSPSHFPAGGQVAKSLIRRRRQWGKAPERSRVPMQVHPNVLPMHGVPFSPPSVATAPISVVAEPLPDRRAGREVPGQKPPPMGQSSRAVPSANAGASERPIHARGVRQCVRASPRR